MLLIAEVAPPAHHYSAWENLGYAFLLSGVAFLFLFYWFGFKIKAKCMVIGSSTRRPCKNDATVVLGCKRRHRLHKPVAWIRHLGAARWLDPWLYRVHIVPPSFTPVKVPLPPLSVAPTSSRGAVAVMARPEVSEVDPLRTGMSAELKIAVWSLVFAVIQAGTGVIALVLA